MHRDPIGRLILTLLISCLAFIVIYKAFNVPVTYDEAGTWRSYVQGSSLGDALLNRGGNSNNHVLNALLIKFSTSLLGTSAFTIRLPNVIAFFFFTWCLYLLAVKYFGHSKVLFFLPFIFFCNPSFTDFFSLARGYGLAHTFFDMVGLLLAAIRHYYANKMVLPLHCACHAMRLR